MSAVVPDTGVLIELLRDPRAVIEKERQRWRFCISAVVHSELVRGADSATEKRFVGNLARAFPPVAPSARDWQRCGEILARLRRVHHFDGRGMQRLQNDVLIALTARQLGLPVVTTNPSDFHLIQGQVSGLKIVSFAV